VFWAPPLILTVDLVSAKTHNIYMADGNTRCYDNQLTIDSAHAAATSFVDEPWANLSAELEGVELDPGPDSRIYGWTGATTGGGAGTTGPVYVDAAEDEEKTISRALKCNLEDKVRWVQDEHSWPDIPDVYLRRKANVNTCSAYGTWPREDPACWSHGFLKAVVTVPASVQETDVITLRVTYREVETPVDNHMTGLDRVIDSETGELCFFVPVGSSRTVEYTVGDLEQGTQNVWFSLMTPTNGTAPVLDIVTQMELVFPAQAAAAQWVLWGMALMPDNVGTDHHLHTHFAEDYRHDVITSGEGKTGGFRGRIDTCSRGVVAHYGFNLWESEPVVPPIKWLLNEDANTFLERAFTLEEYADLISECRNGFALTGDWETYGTGASYDLAQVLNYVADDGVPFALRCGTWQPVPGIEYQPRCSLIIGGGLERVYSKDNAPWRDEIDAVAITRTRPGEDPEEVEELDTDEHGVYASPFYLETYDYEAKEMGSFPHIFYWWEALKYLYQIDGGRAGQLYRRQVLLAGHLSAGGATGGGTMYWRDRLGKTWRADSDGTKITVQYRVSAPNTWSEAVTVVEGDYAQPGGVDPGDGFQLIGAIANTDGTKYQWHTERVDGATWVADGAVA